MTDREKFEAWATTERLHLAMEEGEYMSGVARLAHRTWVASRQQVAEEAAASISKLASSWEESAKRGRGADPLMLELLQICARDARAAIRSLATPTEGKT